MDVPFLKQVEPTRVKLSGGEAALRFTLRAAAEIEAEFGEPYLAVEYEMLGLNIDGTTREAPMLIERQARLIAILLREGGQQVTAEQLMDVDMDDFSLLSTAAIQELFFKSPRGSGKKKAHPET